MRIFEIAGQPLVPVKTPRFTKEFLDFARSNPKLLDALGDFVAFKCNNPSKPHSRKDTGFSSDRLKGFRHEHLALGRVIVIYQIANGQLRLCTCVDHKAIDGAARALSDFLATLEDSSYTPMTAAPEELTREERSDIMNMIYEMAADASDRRALDAALRGDTGEFEQFLELFTDKGIDAVYTAFGGRDTFNERIQAALKLFV